MRLFSALLLTTLLLAPGTAAATDWSGSFPDSQVQAGLPRSGLVVIVLTPEGPHDAEPSLSAALASSSMVRSQVGSASAGDVLGLSDAQILARLSKLPVDVIAVLRTDDSGAQPVATVHYYSPQGAELGTFSTTPQSATRVLTSEKPLERVQTSDDQRSRLEAYRASTVSTEPWREHHPSTEQHYNEWTRSYRGVQREELTRGQLYEAVGRDDLAAKVRRRGVVKPLLGWSGLALINAGPVLAGLFLPQAISSGEAQDWLLPAIGGAATIGGTGLIFGSHGMVVHPVGLEEHQQLINVYNQALAKEHGL